MCQILKKVRDIDANNSEAVKDALTPFFQNLHKHIENDYINWLKCLEFVITRFPKYCASNRNTIETYLINYLDTKSYYCSIAVAKCAHAVQQVRAPQDRTSSPKTCWRDLMNLLCKAAHCLVDAICVNAVDIYKSSTEKETVSNTNSPLHVALNNISTLPNNGNKKTILVTRLRNIFVFIQAMLVEIYPVAKPIQPQNILNVILRSLSATSGSGASDDISEVKVQALKTLDALVACLGSNLIPYSPLVIRLTMQTLRWKSDSPSKEANEVRCAAYDSLGAWFRTLRTHRAAPAPWEDELTAHVLGDVTPDTKIVQLTIGQSARNLSKKAKKKLAKTMLKESAIAHHMPEEKNKVVVTEEANDDVALAALRCAEKFLIVCGRFLKPANHKAFQERLVRECYRESYSSGLLLTLLRTLEACRKTAPSTVPPPTQYCLQLYSQLINHQNVQISSFCCQALLDIRLHLHCSPPSLNFVLEVQQDKGNDLKKRKKVSEKNRAALESLLGPNRIPVQNDEEDIVTLPDEPLTKKPRIEEETDKISVSSTSASSVEICDDSDEDDVQEVQVTVEINNSKDKQVDEDDQVIDMLEEADKGMESDNEVTEITEEATETRNLFVQNSEETNSKEQNIFVQQENNSIFEATTQLPLDVSNDTIDGEERLNSLEVYYDYPNNRSEKPTVLEKLDDENLPSTNDTDDIQITCGQVVKSSQEDIDKKSGDIDKKIIAPETPLTNGTEKTILENGQLDIVNDTENDVDKVPTKGSGISVEDMLADFVDEVNDEVTAT